jgi:lambda repressor-like predicted transcriptional regulator
MTPEKIKERLRKAGISQRMIARRLGVSPNAVNLVIHKRSKSEKITREIASIIKEDANNV